MAVTITQSPALYTPSDNPIVWVFSSNQTGQANFSFIVELYIDGVLDSAHQVFPEVSSYAHWDASEIMQARTHSAARSTSNFSYSADNYRAVSITVREKYGTPATIHASASSGTSYAFKARLSEDEFPNWVSNVFTTGAANRRFLTDARQVLRIHQGFDFYAQIITNQQSNLQAIVELLDENESAIVSVTAANLLNTVRVYSFNMGYNALTNDVGIDPLDYDSAKYVQMYIKNSVDGTARSEPIRYEINRDCAFGGAHTFWLNKYGAYDSFSFIHNAVYSGDVDKQQFERQFGRWFGTEWVNDPLTSGTQTFRKTTTDKVQLVSDYLEEEEQHWIRTLWDSPLVYMQTNVNAIFKMDVTNGPPATADDDYDELYNVTLEMEYANKRKSLLL